MTPNESSTSGINLKLLLPKYLIIVITVLDVHNDNPGYTHSACQPPINIPEINIAVTSRTKDARYFHVQTTTTAT